MNEARKAKLEEVSAIIKAEFPEVDRITLAGARSARLVAWTKNLCIIAEETGGTIQVSAQKLVIALGYRRERLAEMEAERALFVAAVRS